MGTVTCEPAGTMLATAKLYVASGLSIVPIRCDGSKAPAWPWKEYQRRLPTLGELHYWFAGPNPLGLAVVCGAVSGNLEVLDFDDGATFLAWSHRVPPALLARLPQIETPAGGRHVYYRLAARPEGNRKLAQAADGRTLIETRGEGGYVLAPGCPASCHPTGRLYRHVAGPDLFAVPTLGGAAP